MSKEETLSPMQQELLNRADEIFKSIGSAVSTATEFGKEQIPDVAYQYIAFSRAYLSIMEAIAFLIFIIGMWLVVNVAIRDSRKLGADKWDMEWAGSRIVACFFGGFIAFISIIIFLSKLKSLMMVWFAPKIFLIQGIADLAKGLT